MRRPGRLVGSDRGDRAHEPVRAVIVGGDARGERRGGARKGGGGAAQSDPQQNRVIEAGALLAPGGGGPPGGGVAGLADEAAQDVDVVVLDGDALEVVEVGVEQAGLGGVEAHGHDQHGDGDAAQGEEGGQGVVPAARVAPRIGQGPDDAGSVSAGAGGPQAQFGSPQVEEGIRGPAGTRGRGGRGRVPGREKSGDGIHGRLRGPLRGVGAHGHGQGRAAGCGAGARGRSGVGAEAGASGRARGGNGPAQLKGVAPGVDARRGEHPLGGPAHHGDGGGPGAPAVAIALTGADAVGQGGARDDRLAREPGPGLDEPAPSEVPAVLGPGEAQRETGHRGSPVSLRTGGGAGGRGSCQCGSPSPGGGRRESYGPGTGRRRRSIRRPGPPSASGDDDAARPAAPGR